MTNAEIIEKKTSKQNPSAHDDKRIVVMAFSSWNPKDLFWMMRRREGSVGVYPDKCATHIRDNGDSYMQKDLMPGKTYKGANWYRKRGIYVVRFSFHIPLFELKQYTEKGFIL